VNILNWFGKKGLDVYEYNEDYNIKNIGNLVVPEKITAKNAYILANSVPELYFPVDFYADRISKLRFIIANKSGREVASSELNRLISDEINPLYSFSDLIYNYVFSLLSDGNAINYLTIPSIYKTVSPNTVQRWDVLQPNLVDISENTNLNTLTISNLNEAIKRAYYLQGSGLRQELEPERLIIHNSGLRKRNNSIVLSESLLWKANKSIDTLLSVYSARYNVYANNGAAGYLAHKATSNTNSDLESVISGANKREQILADINQRNGITGRRNLWGISGVPIEFVKTLATISELMPFEEVLDDAIKIASVFQIPPVLVPRKDQSTYDNQQGAEKNVWENGLLSMAGTVCQNLTKMFGITNGNKIWFDSSNVSALTQNKSENEDFITKRLANIEKLKQLNPEIDITEMINEISNEYGKG
jgi:hypothetical protein